MQYCCCEKSCETLSQEETALWRPDAGLVERIIEGWRQEAFAVMAAAKAEAGEAHVRGFIVWPPLFDVQSRYHAKNRDEHLLQKALRQQQTAVARRIAEGRSEGRSRRRLLRKERLVERMRQEREEHTQRRQMVKVSHCVHRVSASALKCFGSIMCAWGVSAEV